LSIS
jgi:calnexin